MTIVVKTRAEGKATAKKCPSHLDESPCLRCELGMDEHILCEAHDGPILWIWGTPDVNPEAEIAALRAENEKIRESLAEAAELLDLVETWRIRGVNPRYHEWESKARRALKEAGP